MASSPDTQTVFFSLVGADFYTELSRRITPPFPFICLCFCICKGAAPLRPFLPRLLACRFALIGKKDQGTEPKAPRADLRVGLLTRRKSRPPVLHHG